MSKKKILFASLVLLILIPAVLAFNPIVWIKSLFGRAPPDIERAWADPEKVLPDQIMTTNVIVKDRYGIEEITAEIPHENGVDTVKLHLREGDEYYGTWQNAWKEHSAKNEKWYTTKITVTNKKGVKAYAFVQWQDPTVSHPASQVTAGTFDAGNYTFDATNKDLFIDDTNGRVGIGTGAPGEELEVKGDINATRLCIGTDCVTTLTSLLNYVYYNPSTAVTNKTFNTTFMDVNPENLNFTFTAPSSGNVLIRLIAYGVNEVAASDQRWNLRSGSSNVTDSDALVQEDVSGTRITHTIILTGLTPGSSYTYKWGFMCSASCPGDAYEVIIGCGGTYGPCVMEVWSI